MSNEDEKNIEGQEQETLEPVAENFGEVVETQEAEAADDVESVREAGREDVSRIEEIGGSLEKVEEMTEVVEETTEEAKEAKEEYEEAINSIPNWEDKQESLKRESIDRNELINNIKQTIEDRFSNVSPKDCQALSGFAEYTSLLNYLDTRKEKIEDSEEMKKMDTHQKIEHMQNLCGQCLYEIANDTQVYNFFNENGSNLSSGNNKLDKVIKSVFSIVEHS